MIRDRVIKLGVRAPSKDLDVSASQHYPNIKKSSLKVFILLYGQCDYTLPLLMNTIQPKNNGDHEEISDPLIVVIPNGLLVS